jgi:hypothetical protein
VQLSLSAAAKEVDRSKSTLSRAIKAGRLSATRYEDGSYQIDPAELYRVFPIPVPQLVVSNAAQPATERTGTLRMQLEAAERERDHEREERNREREQMQATIGLRSEGHGPKTGFVNIWHFLPARQLHPDNRTLLRQPDNRPPFFSQTLPPSPAAGPIRARQAGCSGGGRKGDDPGREARRRPLCAKSRFPGR